MVSLTWHACKYKVRKFHQRYFLKEMSWGSNSCDLFSPGDFLHNINIYPRRHTSLFSNHRRLTVSLRECTINSLGWWPLCPTRQIFFFSKSQMSDGLLEGMRLHGPLPLLHEHALICDLKDIPLFFQTADGGQSPWEKVPPLTSASPAWAFPFLWSQRHTSFFSNCRCQTVSLRQRPLLHEHALLCDLKDIPLNLWTAGIWQSPWEYPRSPCTIASADDPCLQQDIPLYFRITDVGQSPWGSVPTDLCLSCMSMPFFVITKTYLFICQS